MSRRDGLIRVVSAERLGQVLSDRGMAAIWGTTLEQAGQIITRVAHPRIREELREAGRALGFWV